MPEARERWREVVGYEGMYEVSDLGRVRSLARRDRHGRRVTGQLLRPRVRDAAGHLSVALSRDAVRWDAPVAELVAAAFIGPRPPGRLIRHRNGVASDNSRANLAYGTQADNWADDVANGVRHYSPDRRADHG